MPERVPSCPTCNKKLESGFRPDKGHGYRHYISTWVAGEPVRSWFGWLSVKAPLDVTTYRCPSCGYLASYARAPTP